MKRTALQNQMKGGHKNKILNCPKIITYSPKDVAMTTQAVSPLLAASFILYSY
jgi:hypothetical protein